MPYDGLIAGAVAILTQLEYMFHLLHFHFKCHDGGHEPCRILLRQVLIHSRGMRVVMLKMKGRLFQYAHKPFLVQETKASAQVYRHVVPGGCLVRIIVPGSAYITVWACENAEGLVVPEESLVVVGLAHDVAGEIEPVLLLFHKYRHLGSHGPALRIR